MQFSKSISDLRRFGRQRTLKSGRLLYADARSTRDCVIRDLTPLGARLKFEIPYDGPDRIILQVGVGDFIRDKVPGCVVWRSEKEIGISFDREFKL
jgi:hypothetical protein